MGLGASDGDMSKLAAVIALGEAVGGDDWGDASGVGEEADRGVYRDHILWPNGDGDRSGEFALTGGRIGVEVSGRNDVDPSGISDRGSHTIEEVLGDVGKIGNREGVDCEVSLVEGEPEGEPWRVAHQEGLVKSGSKGIEEGGGGRRGSLNVGNNNSHHAACVDLDGETKGELAVVGA